jgi:hypothetical protein
MLAKRNLVSSVLSFCIGGLGVWLLCRAPASKQSPNYGSVSLGVESPEAHRQTSYRNEERTSIGASFRWSQLESTDYKIYIANLRGIGCPEQTIRDLIVADVHNLYSLRCQQAANVTTSHPELDSELERLRSEERQVIQALLGGPPGTAQIDRTDIASLPPARVLRTSFRYQEAPIQVPLVFQPLGSGGPKISDEQAQVIEGLRYSFQQDIGSQQDPTDPAYRGRWIQAQQKADQMMTAMLGISFRLDYEAHTETSQTDAK